MEGFWWNFTWRVVTMDFVVEELVGGYSQEMIGLVLGEFYLKR